MSDQRNFFIAIVLSIGIMVGYQLFFAPPPPPPQTQEQQSQTQLTDAQNALTLQEGSEGLKAGLSSQDQNAVQNSVLDRHQALALSPRVTIDTRSLSGSIALKGGVIDDLTLVKYRETTAPDSPNVTLMSPAGAEDAFFAQFRWLWLGQKGEVVPDDAVWTADSETLKAGGTVNLTWKNPQGTIAVVRSISLDDNYLFTITDTVENLGPAAVAVAPRASLVRRNLPHMENFYILHEGPIGVLDGTLKEISYKDMHPVYSEADNPPIKSTGGWLGFSDKYWLSALIPDPSLPINAGYLHTSDYIAEFASEKGMTIEPGASLVMTTRLFAGAKELHVIDGYADAYNITKFDLAIDFGWFYFITKPFSFFLIWLHKLVGSFGLAILAFTVCVKLVLFPLANKSYKAMSKMKLLQPEVKKLQAQYPDDRARMQQEMMALYKREKVNPMSGCLPIVIQIPIFFALYKVLFVTIEMRQAPFYGWIRDLSMPDPTNIFNLFGLIPWDPPTILHLGAWPLIMGITMFLQQKLNPQPTDPMQARMFMIMPIVFTFLLANFAAGLVIYWAWSNTLSIIQQWVIMRRHGVR